MVKLRVIQGGGKGGLSPREMEEEARKQKELEICDECMHYSENNCRYCPEHSKAECKYSKLTQYMDSYIHLTCKKKNWCCTFDHKTTKKKTCEYWIWRQL